MRFLRRHALSASALACYLVLLWLSSLPPEGWLMDRIGDACGSFLALFVVAIWSRFREDGSPEGAGRGG